MSFDGSTFVRHIAERLIHEFEFSRAAGTPGLIGAAKEHPARVQLERLMPGDVRVGSGIVVDSYGGTSKQQDIVIYEKLCPVFAHNETAEATYYPVEGVIAVGEVKSTLGKREILDSVAKSASVKRLLRRAIATEDGLGLPASVSFRNYGSASSFSGTPAEQFDQQRKSLDQVFSFVLCQRFAKEAGKVLDDFADATRAVGVALAPNMLTSLEDGSIYPFKAASGSICRSMMDGDGAMFSRDPIGGFAQMVAMLRLYAVSGHTVDRKHLERYFRPVESPEPTFSIDARIVF